MVPDIDKLYPEFYEWIHKGKGYATASGRCLIKLWYEYLEVKKGETGKARKVA